MDTLTRSPSPTAPVEMKREQSPAMQDKISAYYSLVFPHFTFYVQTLSITIGRRCTPNLNAATSSTAEQTHVDVDLGALKSVSRLHAKIEFDQDEDRFVLVVIGRNGAWVDGVWCGSGTRAALSERQVSSQIQIASRTFHFVLPPPPPPEDSPSPSSQSSNNRPRSPSVDITSISPPSSQPSNSPPPPADRKLPGPPPEPQLGSPLALQPTKARTIISPQLPNSNAIGKGKGASKKRKKADVAEPPAPPPPKPKPEEMPPKPPFTYAQLIYKAIKAIGDKATLQEICTWIMNNYEYYRFTDASWMSSVRHNLSSSRAFMKLERCGGDRGKGFFWKLDEKHSQALEEQEKTAATSGQGGAEGSGGRKKKDKTAHLEPALKRSVKGDVKGPLPPPLTSTPLQFKTSATSTATSPTPVAGTSTSPPVNPSNITSSTPATTGVFAYPSQPHSHHGATTIKAGTIVPGYHAGGHTNPYAAWAMHTMATGNAGSSTSSATPPVASPPPAQPAASTSALPGASQPSVKPAPAMSDVNLPIVLGPIPATHADYSPTHPNNSAKEGYMILHDRTLILDPGVFGGLTKEQMQELEKMGTMKALQVLKDHMVKVLKERRAKGKSKKEKSGKRKKGEKSASGPNGGHTMGLKGEAQPSAQSSGFANGQVSSVPVNGGPALPPVSSAPAATSASNDSAAMDVAPSGETDPGTPIVIVDDSEEDALPAAKRRKVEEGVLAS